MCRKYGDPRIILDTAYNLVYSWHSFSWDADCYMFLKMLMGALFFIVAACICESLSKSSSSSLQILLLTMALCLFCSLSLQPSLAPYGCTAAFSSKMLMSPLLSIIVMCCLCILKRMDSANFCMTASHCVHSLVPSLCSRPPPSNFQLATDCLKHCLCLSYSDFRKCGESCLHGYTS